MRYLVLISATSQTCGVEEFARLLAERFGGRARTRVLDFNLAGLRADLKDCDALVMNFPVVAWKKKLLEPALAALVARLSARKTIVVLHEWAALDWKRRLVLAPVVLLAHRIFFSAPEIAAEFAASPLSVPATNARGIVPIPPNLSAPAELRPGAFSERLRAERNKGRLVLGQFGSIYPQKQVTSVLSVAADLKARGTEVFVAFAGSFIKGQDSVEADFLAAVERLGLTGSVAVSGFIETEAELFAIFREIDVFCYLLPGGVTARRASVLAAAISGRPVVVNAPANTDALAHHRLFQRMIDGGQLRLIATDADTAMAADAVLAASRERVVQPDLVRETDDLWQDVVARIDNNG